MLVLFGLNRVTLRTLSKKGRHLDMDQFPALLAASSLFMMSRCPAWLGTAFSTDCHR